MQLLKKEKRRWQRLAERKERKGEGNIRKTLWENEKEEKEGEMEAEEIEKEDDQEEKDKRDQRKLLL